jgi:hypothetical protein
MARASLWLTAASILAVFDIRKVIRADGTCMEPSSAQTNSFVRYVSCLAHIAFELMYVSHPEPFECEITPRSEEIKKSIKAHA